MQQRIRFSIVIILTFLGCLQVGAQSVNLETRKAKGGMLDLREVNLLKQSIKLEGEWIVYPQQLLSPKDNFDTAKGYFTHFPELWSKTIINGQPLPSKGYATYRLKVLMPSTISPDDLALDIPDVYSTMRLYVNEEDFFNLGKPGTTKATTIPHFKPGAKRLHFRSDTLVLTVQIANFHHRRGGAKQAIILGNNNVLKIDREMGWSYDLFLTGCLFMGGLFFLGLFIFGRHDRVILYFSLFCLVYTYRVVGTDEYALHHLFPNISWFITIRLEYLSLFGSVIFLALFNYHLYPREFNQKLCTLFVAVGLICFGITLVFPPDLFTHLLNYYIVFVFIQLIYTVYVYILGYRHKQPGALLSLLSTAILFIIYNIIIAGFFTAFVPNRFLLLFLYICFFFFQSLVLSYRFAFVLKKARDEALLAVKAKSEFLSTMSHEIRTPLNSVIGITNLLLQKKPEGEQKEYLDTLLFSANNLLFIINDILDFSKLEAGKMQISYTPTILADIGWRVASTSKILANEKGILLEFYGDEILKTQPVLADPDRTTQVINNLIMNAIKFTTEGSVHLHMKVKAETATHITVKISIQDTGIGIPKEKQALIFEEFTQVDSEINRGYAGTGLGLAICKEILAKQQVSLELDSEPAIGSTFWFEQSFEKTNLIQNSNELKVPALSDAEVASLFLGKVVLIAEDNTINMMVAQKVLNGFAPGLIIKKATTGQEAIDMYQEEIPDIILMDINMPVMDGLRATKIIRNIESLNHKPQVPIIALTAGTLREDEDRCKDAGMDTMIAKPFKIDELKNTMLKFMDLM